MQSAVTEIGDPKFLWLIYEGKDNADLGTRELCV